MIESIWLGNDPREQDARTVARKSMLRHMKIGIPIHDLSLRALQEAGLYRRPTSKNNGRLIDELSVRSDYDGSMSTEHAISRFLVPKLAKTGWALFTDSDVMARADIGELFDGLSTDKALYCVHHDKHHYSPKTGLKMDRQKQVVYPRKNYSSVMAFNCDHPANDSLTIDMINTLPGKDLHRFCWLADEEIGELSPSWNWLVGQHYPVAPKLVHFTEGTPDMPGYEGVQYSDEWRSYLA